MMSRAAAYWVPLGALLAALASVATLAYLLYAFPYNGLYGVDSYAYAGQSAALLNALAGLPPRPGALFTTEGFAHWPVGYHLHLVLGRLLSGGSIVGGRVLTLALAVAVPVLAYLLVVRISPFRSRLALFTAGLVAAGAILLTSTFTRTGTSVMSDVPAMFWALLATVIVVWRWPPPGVPSPSGRQTIWAAAAGFSLGVATLVRYPCALVAVPLLIYIALRYRATRDDPSTSPKALSAAFIMLIAAVVGFAVAMAPQAVYLLTHDPGPEAGQYFTAMTVANYFSRSTSGPDGQAVFPRTMLEFYLVSPAWETPVGFLPWALVPFLLIGALVLFLRRGWAVLALLLTWWVLPALTFAATPYQTHRFALLYLPAIVAFIGIGAGAIIEFAAGPSGSTARRPRAWAAVFAIAAVALLAFAGVQGVRSARSWEATHAMWQAADEDLSKAVQAAAGPGGRAICLPSCVPVDFYAELPVLDMYNNDDAALAAFIRPGQTAAAVTERTLATQWAASDAGRHLQARWAWLTRTYKLERVGSSGEYTIYRVDTP